MFKKKINTPPTRRQRLSADRQAMPQSFSYHRVRSEEDANTGRQFNRPAVGKAAKSLGRFWIQRFGLAILLIVAVVCLFDVLNLSASPRVIVLGSSNDTALQGLDIYQAAFTGYMQRSVFNHNKLTVNTAQLGQQLQQHYPEISKVAVALPLLAHRPVVYIEPAEPAVIVQSSSGAYVLDTNGRALLTADSLSTVRRAALPIVTDQSGLHVSLNQQVLTGGDVSFIQMVVAQLSAKQIVADTMVLPAATRELDVHLTGQPFIIKLNLQSGDAQQQIGTFLAVYTKLKSQNIVPAQYVDVRVDGRAYYK